MDTVLGFLCFCFCFFASALLSLLPGIVASARGHASAPAIWAIALLLGWTGVGWAFALIWALSDPAGKGATVVIDQRKERRGKRRKSRPSWED